MYLFSVRNLWIALLLCVFPHFLFAQIGPCYGNAQAGTWVCPGNNVTVSMASACTTCVYSWGGNPVSGAGTPNAQYSFPANPYPAAFTTGMVTASYIDTAGVFCTGIGSWAWEVGIWGSTQMSNPVLLNGPYDGDTSKTWIYAREHIGWSTLLTSWDYNRTYTITGGSLQASVVNLLPDWNGNYFDTLWIKWNNTANRSIGTSGSLTGSYFGWGLQTPGWCNNYSEAIPPQPLQAAFATGPDTLCPGDTATYYTTPVPNATYTWTITGGTILSGQGTAMVQVLWNAVPGTISVSRDLNGNTSVGSLSTSSVNFGSNSVLPQDTALCSGSPLVLDAGPASSWLWSTGDTTQTITVNDSGNYAVTVNDFFCGMNNTLSDTIRVDHATPVLPNLGPDRTFCMGTPQVFNLGSGFSSALWMGGPFNQLTFTTFPNFVGGPIWVATVDTNGCTGQDTVHLTSIPVPTVNLGPSPTFCIGDSALLDAGNPGATYLWSTGDTTQTIYVTVGGTFSVDVTANGCTGTGSVTANAVPLPNINLGPDSTFCNGDSMILNAGNPGATYLWSNGATSQTIWYQTPGVVSVIVNQQGCVGTDSLTVYALADCVWPGDCDNDGTANNFDVLVLGTVWGQSGPVRPAATTNWEGQEAPDWPTSIPNGPNTKHADPDGNGLINWVDTVATHLNYGLTHNKTNGLAAGASLDLIADFDSVMAGDTATFRVRLSDNLNPVDSVYGIAFSINFDSSLVAGNRMLYTNYSDCWLSSPSRLLNFTKVLFPEPQVDIAVVRTTLNDTIGQGEICSFAFVTKSDISGKRAVLAKTLHVSLSNPRFVDHNLIPLNVMPGQDSTVIYQNELVVPGPAPENRLQVSPNPAHNQLRLQLGSSLIADWVLYDVCGSRQAAATGLRKQNLLLPTGDLANGIYFLQVTDDDGHIFQQKILIRHP